MHLRPALAALVTVLAAAAIPASASAATNLAAFWHLDGGAGATVADSSGNANTGTISGATFVGGRFGPALTFDGLDDKVTVPRSSTLEPANVTVEAWVRAPSSPGRFKHLVAQGGVLCGTSSYGLYSGGAGGLVFYMNQSPAGDNFALSPDAGQGVWDGAWHHVAGTFDGATVRLYVDGAQVGSGTPTGLSILYPLAVPDTFLGGFSSDCISDATGETLNYKGDLDEARIWRRAMNGEELAASAAMGAPTATQLSERIDSSQAIVHTSSFSDGENVKISIESATGAERIRSVKLVGLTPLTARATCRGGPLSLLNSACDHTLSNGGLTTTVTVRRLLGQATATLRVGVSSGRTFDVRVAI